MHCVFFILKCEIFKIFELNRSFNPSTEGTKLNVMTYFRPNLGKPEYYLALNPGLISDFNLNINK